MLSASFKPDNTIFAFPIDWIPDNFTWSNYNRVWNSDVPFSTFFGNSVKVTLLSVAGEVFTSSLAAYAFAKIKFKGRDVIFLIYLSTLAFPAQMMLISEIYPVSDDWSLQYTLGVDSSRHVYCIRNIYAQTVFHVDTGRVE